MSWAAVWKMTEYTKQRETAWTKRKLKNTYRGLTDVCNINSGCMETTNAG